MVRDGLRRLKLGKVELAVDTTKDRYFGKELAATRRTKYAEGTDLVWEYVVVSVVKPVSIPLMALPYTALDQLHLLVIDLLKYVQTLGLNVKKIYFDRGFYSWHLIDYLESSKLRYLIFLPKNGKIKSFIEQTKGKLGVYDHEGSYCRDKTKWKVKSKVVVCKEAGENRKGEKYDMAFATNLPARHSLAGEYRQRWNIETSFRVAKEAKIKTKSNNPRVRYFYFILRLLFMLIWKVKSLTEKVMTIFKTFLRQGREYFRQHVLNIIKPVHRPP